MRFLLLAMLGFGSALMATSNGSMFCANVERNGQFLTAPLTSSNPNVLWESTEIGFLGDPTVTSAAVLAYNSGTGQLVALSPSDGSLLWAADLGDARAGPITADETLGIAVIGTQQGTLQAFDLTSGAPLWTANIGGGAALSPASSNGVVYAMDDTGTICAFSGSDGSLVWQRTLPFRSPGSMSLSKGVLLTFVSRGDGRGMVMAYSASNGNPLWSRTFDRLFRWTPVIADGRVVIADSLFSIAALNLSTGATLWTTKVATLPNVGVTVADGTVYLLDQLGRIEAFELSNGNPLYTSVGTGLRTVVVPPVIAGEVLYYNDLSEGLLAFDRTTAARLFRFTAERLSTSQPVIRDGICYLTTREGRLIAIQ
ncbi:MAG: PQQ-binding-like beta-propeller repeat protein [Parachlamydiales bacterium]